VSRAQILLCGRDTIIDTQLFDLEWDVVLTNLLHILVAYLIALPIGWERERTGGGMGLRTFPLVALASCGYLLVARDLAGGNPDAESRVIQGLLGGIGFIGGGAILKEGGTVRGTATAASIWNTGAIGFAVAFDHLEIAIVLGLVNFLTLRWLTPFKQAVEPDTDRSVS
jgi:putative Mg2+ transporter-C (MgtC) family protein